MKGIYVLTCEVNGKEYVGKGLNVSHRVYCHLNGHSKSCRLIRRAIKKHGRDNFTVQIIRYPNVPHQILCWFERSHIAERNTKAPNGYNLTDGGEGSVGYKHSAEQKKKIRASTKKALSNPVTRAKMSKSHKGKRHSAETKEKIAASKRGKKRPDLTGKNNPMHKTVNRSASSHRIRKRNLQDNPMHNPEVVKSRKAKRLERNGQGTLF